MPFDKLRVYAVTSRFEEGMSRILGSGLSSVGATAPEDWIAMDPEDRVHGDTQRGEMGDEEF